MLKIKTNLTRARAEDTKLRGISNVIDLGFREQIIAKKGSEYENN